MPLHQGITNQVAEPITSVPIPQWEIVQLENLSGSGQLSGVDPLDLAVIDQAESSGRGGGINSSGYGGWFGLGVGKQYPTGSIPAATMRSTTPQAFDQQATVAAGEFASLLGQHGGNPIAAEMAYQGGSTEGAKLFQQAGIGGTQTETLSYNQSATTTANSSGGGGFNIDLNPIDWFTSAFQPILTGAEDFGLSILFIVLGLALVLGALLYFAIKGNNSAMKGITQGLAPQAPQAAPLIGAMA